MARDSGVIRRGLPTAPPILKRALGRNLEFSTAHAAFEKIVVISAADTVEATLFRFFNPTAWALENVSDARLIAGEPLLRAGSDCGGGSIGVFHKPCFDTISLSHFASGRPGSHDGMSAARRGWSHVQRRASSAGISICSMSNVRAALGPLAGWGQPARRAADTCRAAARQHRGDHDGAPLRYRDAG
jgi:hypothetical protein